MRKKVAEDKDATEDKKVNRRTKCGSQGDKRRQRMGHGRQSGPKWAMGISGHCSEAHWFKARNGMGPEKKARAVRRLRKPEWVMGAPHMKRGAEQKQEVVGIRRP